MIEVLKKSKKKKTEPHYQLVYEYMIGDADGYTKEKTWFDIGDPYLERYCKLLMNMEPADGYWGVSLSSSRIYLLYTQGKLSKDDYDFLSAIMFNDYGYMGVYDDDKKVDNPFKLNFEVFDIYSEGIVYETEYSFLSLENITLYYIDEYGEKFKTKFVD